jgi:acetylornithine deacetylase/succinyl-diaminopimelate desuccinylase-like protein
MTVTAEELVSPTTELLQSLIRNECVNDGTPDSGNEIRNAELLAGYFEGAGIDVERFESRPGRASIVARIDGSDPSAPTLCLMGHTDVVPANADGWSHDPFGGELIRAGDGTVEVWGRGAIDMLNSTAAMAVAFRRLAVEGFRPRGTLIYFGVADEEAGGGWGAEHVLDHHWDAVGADYVLTELGGWSQIAPDGRRRIAVNVAEKGLAWLRLRVAGTPGHGSMPYRTDNALVTAAEVVRRLADYRTEARLGDLWEAYLAGLDVTDDVKVMLADPQRVDEALATLGTPSGRLAHACSHTTISPNVVHGGQKTNTIPDVVDIEVDIRTVPGDTIDTARRYVAEALGELAGRVDIGVLQHSESTRSPTDNALWDVVERQTRVAYPGAELVPGLIVGGTDARFYRQRGTVAYGAALFSPGMTFESFGQRFHGNDERIDVESLGLCGEFFYGVSNQLLS